MLFKGAVTKDEPIEETNEVAKQFDQPLMAPYQTSRSKMNVTQTDHDWVQQ